ncbi:uncharacterized protein LOC106663291 [Cimex lectularius]|uniref:Secreted protein n=1 Tax=Cimex lectularius TaxID=79782 RepID=A0A8I6SMX4_CIMLE|nr:uncharacterized protein LOC106663291 [Cimex lectularius]
MTPSGLALLKTATILVVATSALIETDAFIIIPEDFTTLSNAIWSFLPPIKSGLLSKVGLGFRLGRNADFQVLFEIGPQMNNTNTNRTDATVSPNAIAPQARSKRTKYSKRFKKLPSK